VALLGSAPSRKALAKAEGACGGGISNPPGNAGITVIEP
jgi:hypothetical protein